MGNKWPPPSRGRRDHRPHRDAVSMANLTSLLRTFIAAVPESVDDDGGGSDDATRILRVLSNPAAVRQPWPWPRKSRLFEKSPDCIYMSPDKSIAVAYFKEPQERRPNRFMVSLHRGRYEIWDRFSSAADDGPLAIFEGLDYTSLRPSFSPDGEFLVLTSDDFRSFDFRVVRFAGGPETAQQRSIASVTSQVSVRPGLPDGLFVFTDAACAFFRSSLL